MSTLNDLMRYVPPDRFKRMSKDRNFISQLSRNASVDVLSRKTFDRLNAIARGEVEAAEKAAGEETASPETPAMEADAPETAPINETQPATEMPAETSDPSEDGSSSELPVTETNQEEG